VRPPVVFLASDWAPVAGRCDPRMPAHRSYKTSITPTAVSVVEHDDGRPGRLHRAGPPRYPRQ
jgi:hypothetical protein